MADRGELTKLFIAFMVGSGLLVAMAYFWSDMGDEYGFETNSSTFQSIDQLQNLQNEVSTAENTTAEGGIELSTTLETPYTGAWNAVLGLLDAPTIMGNFIEDLLDVVGINVEGVWFTGIIFGVIAILILAAVVRVFIGRSP